jgi:hypothetical protein
MKTKSKCIGCQSIKLVNTLGLCKRCNRHAHDFITKDEMDRMKRERELLMASRGKKAKKGETTAEEKESEEETSEEEAGEGDEKGESEGKSDAGSGSGGEN